MATNGIHTGNRVQLTLAVAVASNQFMQIGDQVVLFLADAEAGEPVTAMRGGHYEDAPKEGGVGLEWSQFETLYWDAANERFTTDDGAGANLAVAVAGADAGENDVVGEVILVNSVS